MHILICEFGSDDGIQVSLNILHCISGCISVHINVYWCGGGMHVCLKIFRVYFCAK